MNERVTLGQTEIRISPIGVGTWQWGDRLYWGYGRTYGEADLEQAFLASLEAGLNFFDTAEIYGFGRSERLLGRFAGESPGTTRDIVIATKFFPFPWRVLRRDLVRGLRASLSRLGLERVDLYQVHWPAPPRSVKAWADALADAVDAGLARAVGVSNYNRQQTLRAHEALGRHGVPLASNQVSLSLLDRRHEHNGLLDLCRELGVTVIAYSPLAQGMLAGKYGPARPPPPLRRLRGHGRKYRRLEGLLDLIREIGQAHGGRTAAQVSLNWVMAKGAVPVPGAKNAQQALENAGALGWRLGPDEVAALDEAGSRV